MFTSVLLVFLVATMPTTEAPSNPKSAESLKVSLGDMTFTGKSIELTSGQSNQAESNTPIIKCAIDGDAHVTLNSNPHITIAAQNMVITSFDHSGVLIRCTGECKLTGILLLKEWPDRIRIKLDKPVLLTYGPVHINTTPWAGGYIAGESMIFSDASFLVKGTEAFKLGEKKCD